jgi:hypothetical protein
MATIGIGNDPAWATEPVLATGIPASVEYYSTIQRSMFTLTQIMTMDSWADLARIFMADSAAVPLFVIFYASLAGLILMNLMVRLMH